MIKAIITDFDGTLVNTFESNFRAYQSAFQSVDLELSETLYRKYYGFRFDDLMLSMGIYDDQLRFIIKDTKKKEYPKYFHLFQINRILFDFLNTFHSSGGLIALASTARKENLYNALSYLQIQENFDLIYSGADVMHGKPSPEIYTKAIEKLGINKEDTLIFEDSKVGIEAAKASGAKVIQVTEDWFKR